MFQQFNEELLENLVIFESADGIIIILGEFIIGVLLPTLRTRLQGFREEFKAKTILFLAFPQMSDN